MRSGTGGVYPTGACLLLSAMHVVDLAANLATRRSRRVNVHVRLTGAEGKDQACKIARCDALAQGTDNVGRSDHALDLARARRVRADERRGAAEPARAARLDHFTGLSLLLRLDDRCRDDEAALLDHNGVRQIRGQVLGRQVVHVVAVHEPHEAVGIC